MSLIFDEQEAQLIYAGGDYQIVKNGSYVRCAVTGQKIPLNDLHYWSIERQEPYADCRISYERELESHPELRKLFS